MFGIFQNVLLLPAGEQGSLSTADRPCNDKQLAGILLNCLVNLGDHVDPDVAVHEQKMRRAVMM
jgi:hypothetical protein